MILFKELKNPYRKDCPFFEDFERIISKCRHLTDNLLQSKLQEQHHLYNDEESDGLTIYNAEELALAIRIVQFERNPTLFTQKKEELIVDRAADIPDVNTHPKGSPMFNLFEKEVAELIRECSKKELEDDLKKEIKTYNSNQKRNLEAETALYYSIQSLKAAIKRI